MNAAVTLTELRESFEAWAVKWGHAIDRSPGDGTYINRITAACWHAYRAALGIVK